MGSKCSCGQESRKASTIWSVWCRTVSGPKSCVKDTKPGHSHPCEAILLCPWMMTVVIIVNQFNRADHIKDHQAETKNLRFFPPTTYHEFTVTRLGTMDWFQIGQGYVLLPCLFNFYAEYIMQNAGLEDSQIRIKIVRRNINNLR